jgi:hypothetical protein
MTYVYKTAIPHTPEQLYSAYKQRNEIEIMAETQFPMTVIKHF